MYSFQKIWKNYNEIQLTKNKMDSNSRIMKNHPPSPESEVWEGSRKIKESKSCPAEKLGQDAQKFLRSP